MDVWFIHIHHIDNQAIISAVAVGVLGVVFDYFRRKLNVIHVLVNSRLSQTVEEVVKLREALSVSHAETAQAVEDSKVISSGVPAPAIIETKEDHASNS